MNALTMDDFVHLCVLTNERKTDFAVAPVMTDGTNESLFDQGESTKGYIRVGFMLMQYHN